jgi:5S rRNA maturation endonuclease (ribonuclease M5)
MNGAEAIALALNGRKSSNGSWSAKCPAHDDHNPSLSISEGANGPLVHCFVCKQGDVIEVLRARGLWPRRDGDEIPASHAQLGPIGKFWDYQDGSGRHVMRVCRWDRANGKEIRPLTFQAGRWTWKQLERDRPLYRLPALKDTSKRVIVCEGEKTADAAQKYFEHMTATTWAGGAKAISKTDWKPLAGRDVTLVPDNDEPGRKAMDQVAEILLQLGCTVRRVDLTPLGNLPQGWDIADALGDKAFDLEVLWRVIEGAQETKPVSNANEDYELVHVGALLSAQAPPSWTIHGLLEAGVNAGLVAPPEHAKSLFALHMAACVATGKPFHGREVRKGLAVYLCGEGFNGMRKRVQALELYHDMGLSGAPLVISRTSASLLDATEAARVRSAIERAQEHYGEPLTLLVIDTLARFIAPGKESDAPDMGAYFATIDYLRGGATAVSLHHPGHGDQTRARGSSSWRAALDTEFTFAMSGDVVTATCSKMKDAEKPEPLTFRIQTAPTMTAREDGTHVQSVVLVATDAPPVTRKPTGRNQKLLLAELERRHETGERLWTEKDLRSIAKDLGMGKSSAVTTVMGLRQLGYLTDTVGGARLSHFDAVGYGSTETVRNSDSVPVHGVRKVPVSLETVLPSRTSVPATNEGQSR